MNTRLKVQIIFWLLSLSTLPVFAQDHDTFPHVKLHVIDKNLVFPKPISPETLCRDLKTAWAEYLKVHKNLNKEFDLSSDSSSYYLSFWIEIDKSGKVISFKKSGYFSEIEAVGYNALSSTIKRSFWQPFYRRSKNNKIYLITKGMFYLGIDKGVATSIHMSELETGKEFFKCDD